MRRLNAARRPALLSAMTLASVTHEEVDRLKIICCYQKIFAPVYLRNKGFKDLVKSDVVGCGLGWQTLSNVKLLCQIFNCPGKGGWGDFKLFVQTRAWVLIAIEIQGVSHPTSQHVFGAALFLMLNGACCLCIYKFFCVISSDESFLQ